MPPHQITIVCEEEITRSPLFHRLMDPQRTEDQFVSNAKRVSSTKNFVRVYASLSCFQRSELSQSEIRRKYSENLLSSNASTRAGHVPSTRDAKKGRREREREREGEKGGGECKRREYIRRRKVEREGRGYRPRCRYSEESLGASLTQLRENRG